MVGMRPPAPVSSDRLELLLQERNDIAQRPRPTPGQVMAGWLQNAGAATGIGIVAAVGLWVLRAPDGVLMFGPVAIGLLAFGGSMAWRGLIDEWSDWRNVRAIRRTLQAARQEYDSQVRTLRRQLDMAFDEIETLERSLDQTARERDMALADLGRERQLAQQNTRSTFVRAEDPQPQGVRDANEMIRHYFDTRTHLSRRRAAEDKRWSAERWKAAQSLLERAGVLAVNATQPVMLAQTLGEALGKLNTYLVHARSQQPPVMAQRSVQDAYDST